MTLSPVLVCIGLHWRFGAIRYRKGLRLLKRYRSEELISLSVSEANGTEICILAFC